MNILAKILSVICFGGADFFSIIASTLYIAAMWKIFAKSSVKSFWAVIPHAREYMLARCAGREPEGRVTSVASFFMMVANIVNILDPSATQSLFLDIIVITVGLIMLVYSLRVYSGLTEVYGRKKRWVFLWIFPLTESITAILWGFSKKFQPQWKVEDLTAQLKMLAHSGNAAVLDEGLTINLNARTATEFFQKKYLLRDIHMLIPKGHMVLLLGGSGAGKTTFLNAVNGYEKADAEIMLNGSNLYKNYKDMMYEIGFVPQQELMREKDTVRNTLLDAARLRLSFDIPLDERKARVDEVMKIFGLLPVRNNLVEKLSGGQKKRLSIAMEFISNPSLFILDEPDSGLDGVMARELMVQLRKIADMGRIVVVITHTPDRVIDLFDDVIVLAKDSARTGRLAYYGPIEEARTFFGKDTMEEIVKSVNRKEEGGDGLADEFVSKYMEVQHA